MSEHLLRPPPDQPPESAAGGKTNGIAEVGTGDERTLDRAPAFRCPSGDPSTLDAESGALAPKAGEGHKKLSSGDVTATNPGSSEPAVVVTSIPVIPGYEIFEILGRGGMGVVYRARQIALDRLVALKMILSGRHAGGSERERFQLEAETVARLQHPNIVQIHEVGEIEGTPYFSLEYVAGGNLAERLKGTPMPALQAAGLVEILALAVETAHRAGILHRDLKPANVLIADDGTPKIADFGLAKRLAICSTRSVVPTSDSAITTRRWKSWFARIG